MRNFKNALLACAAGAAILLTGGAMRVYAANIPLYQIPVLIQGTVIDNEDDRLRLSQSGPEANGQEVILNTDPEQTRILDAVSGLPIALDSIRDGETVYAYVGPAMTLSLPPIANAELILANIPADFKVPEYVIIESMQLGPDQTSGTLTAAGGAQYIIPSDARLLPYLTRNIVTLQDLTPGTTALIWTEPDSNRATKVMVFPDRVEEENGSPEASVTGWVMKDGKWYYYDRDGALYTGWLDDQGNWYYLDPEDGAMRTGFLTLGNNTYYLQENGQMLTTPRTFTPDANGILH